MVEKPRINIVSLRNVFSERFRGHGYEFEDAIMALDKAHLSLLAPTKPGSKLLKDLRRATREYVPSLYKRLGPGYDIQNFTQNSDLLFVYFCTPGDMLIMDSIPDWKNRSGTSVCWVQELWLRAMEKNEIDFRILNRFDNVICSMKQSAARLGEILDVPVTYLPWGIDAVAASPFPENPNRVIDFNNISNVSAKTHAAVKRMAKERGLFYLYDTAMGPGRFVDHADHRDRFREYNKRTKFFFTPLAKRDLTERGGQVEFGARYIEGAAGGAILVGDRPSTSSFEEYMGWEDSVIEMPYELDNVESFFDGLNNDPVRLRKIHYRNSLECLKRHDYAYRWQDVLKIAGLEESKELQQRLKVLQDVIFQSQSALNQYESCYRC